MEPKKKQPQSYLINVGKKGHHDITVLAKLLGVSNARLVNRAVGAYQIIRTLNADAQLDRPRKETR
jgi:hypothetical protein